MHRQKFQPSRAPVTGTLRQENKEPADGATYHFILLFDVTVDFGGNHDWVRTCHERVLGDGVADVSNGNFRGECLAVIYHWLAG